MQSIGVLLKNGGRRPPTATLSHEGRGERNTALSHLPERQIDTLPAHHSVLAVGEWCDAVKRQPRRAAPHRDVAVLDPKPPRPVAALGSAEQEDRGQAQRDRDDRRGEIGLVLVL